MRRTCPLEAVVFNAFWMTVVSSPPYPALPKLKRDTEGPFEMAAVAAVELGADADAAGDELTDPGLRRSPPGPPPQPNRTMAMAKRRGNRAIRVRANTEKGRQ